MNAAIWVASFFYLALLSGWVTTAVREGYDSEPDSAAPAGTLKSVVGFVLMLLAATLLFGVGIALIEWLA